ncbi:MAG: DEAD/DEAH box helicase [Bacilli bacterium]
MRTLERRIKMKFTDFALSEPILQAIELMKYKEPTDVQQSVIPLIMEEKDIVVRSQTGSGKTAAFAIPLCEKIDWDEYKPQVLILTPTRELAVQVKEDVMNIGRLKRIRATAVFGKQPMSEQIRELKQKSHVVVGTPGRVMDHVDRGTLDLSGVAFLVIDEADEMLSRGFIQQVETIIECLPRIRTTMLFSATIPQEILALSKKYMYEPLMVEMEHQDQTAPDIQHFLFKVELAHKLQLLQDVFTVEAPESAIIFCATKEQTDMLYNQVSALKWHCAKLHGGLLQEERLQIMKDFKLGKFRYLIATDVAARGLDIHDISLVVNYDVPMEKESYVHRSGRTGRAGRSGKAITFATSFEERYVKNIEQFSGITFKIGTRPAPEDVKRNAPTFKRLISEKPKQKKDMNAVVGQDIMKLYFNGGKKKKLRAFDFVGTISNLEGVTAEDIGIIDVQENVTYVDILNGKGAVVLEAMMDKTVKGKTLKVQRAKK